MENSRTLLMWMVFYFIFLCLPQCQGSRSNNIGTQQTPLQPKLRVVFPDEAEDFILMRSLVALPDDSLLLGDIMTHQPIFRITLNQPPEVFTMPTPERLYDGDVKSLAVVNDHQFFMSTKSFFLDHDVLKLLTLDDTKTRIIKVEDVAVPEHRKNNKWMVIAAGPENGTFLFSGKDASTRKSFVDLITVDGQMVDTIMDDLDFQITSMMFHNGDVYLMTGWSYTANPTNLHKLNLASKTFSSSIGDLDITALGSRIYFFQGGFDSQGNLYIAVKNTTGCDEAQSQCCRCVMLITTDGEMRVLINYSEEEKELNAVIVTSLGFVTSSSLVEGHYIRRREEVQVFDLV